MNAADYAVLFGSILAIALYGILRTRGRRNLHDYLRGRKKQSGFIIGLSVMATQASAITFLSTPGQGYAGGLSFVQNYFAMPLALIIIAALFLPLYRKLNVYTAYQFLGARFDTKTRLLTAALFLLQRGMGAGITIYAPAIVLSTVFGWSLSLTIIASSLIVIIYTVAGGSDAVTHTQKYQLAVIFAGMIAAFVILLHKIPCSFPDALAIAGHFGKINAVSFSTNPHERYTFWTGMLGGLFLMLSYFGADQSQVQRYIAGDDLRESRIGLMFNAVLKIPMQFGILLLGVMLFVFYLFNPAPLLFNKTAMSAHQDFLQHAGVQMTESSYQAIGDGRELPPGFTRLPEQFQATERERQRLVWQFLNALQKDDTVALDHANMKLASATDQLDFLRDWTQEALKSKDPSLTSNDSDYIFIDFILDNLPHGLIGLLVAAFFAAALSSKAAELNALATTTTIDFYRHFRTRATDVAPISPNPPHSAQTQKNENRKSKIENPPPSSDRRDLLAAKLFTVMWGLIAMGFALFAHLSENLIQAANIIGSLFYGVILALFLIAFFLKPVRGTAAFAAALIAETLVLVMFAILSISYLWYNLIGCAVCILLALLLQAFLPSDVEPRGFEPVMEQNA